MALKIRLQRGGNTNRPAYRVVVAESAKRRDGRFVEKVGHYVPRHRKDRNIDLGLNLERIDYWISVGAKPTETVATLIKDYRKNGVQTGQVAAPVVIEAPKAEVIEAPKAKKIPAPKVVVEKEGVAEKEAPKAPETPKA